MPGLLNSYAANGGGPYRHGPRSINGRNFSLHRTTGTPGASREIVAVRPPLRVVSPTVGNIGARAGPSNEGIRRLPGHANHSPILQAADVYAPTSPTYEYPSQASSPQYSPIVPSYTRPSPEYNPPSPTYTPTSPTYTPTSPTYSNNSPSYAAPDSPTYEGATPDYNPTSSVYSESPQYGATRPHNVPSSSSLSTPRRTAQPARVPHYRQPHRALSPPRLSSQTPAYPTHNFSTRIPPPGAIETQPTSKMVFNAPFKTKLTQHFEVLNVSSNFMAYRITTNNAKRIGIDQPLGVLRPHEVVTLAVSCAAFDYWNEERDDDVLDIEYRFVSDDADVRGELFQRNFIVRNKILKIEYNM